jgi:hypothetical protein
MKLRALTLCAAMIVTTGAGTAAAAPKKKDVDTTKVAKANDSIGGLQSLLKGLPSTKPATVSCPSGGTVTGTFTGGTTASVTFAQCKDGGGTYDGGPIAITFAESSSNSGATKTTQSKITLVGVLSIAGDKPVKLATDGLTLTTVTITTSGKLTSSVLTIGGKAKVDGVPMDFAGEKKVLYPAS